MDRREALKKLAVGGGAVIGASTIVSSPVFAFGNPPTVMQPIWGGNAIMGGGTFNFVQELATCPASASAQTAPTTASLNITDGTLSANVAFADNMGTFEAAGMSTIIQNAATGATLTFTIVTMATCMYAGGDSSTTCTTVFSTSVTGAMTYSPNPPTVSSAQMCV